MMLGENSTPPHPTIHVPPWPPSPSQLLYSPTSNSDDFFSEALLTLQRYLPSNDDSDTDPYEPPNPNPNHGPDSHMDTFSSDDFRMYEFKVRRCSRGRSHDWTECPFAHPGEKARRRDPRKFHYSGTACPDFRKGNCKRGDSCEFAHGVFECWLHPARYRTQPCKDGTACRRRVCFFAHTPDQLRLLPPSSTTPPPSSSSSSPSPSSSSLSPSSKLNVTSIESYDGSPLRSANSPVFYGTKPGPLATSPTSTLLSPPISPPSDSPPLSPINSSLRRSVQVNSVNQVLASLRQLQLSKANSMPASWGLGYGSPKISSTAAVAAVPTFFRSLPSTPTTVAGNSRWVDVWDVEEEPMERVESGRDLRAKIFEKLRKENLGERSDAEANPFATAAPDVDWVSDLVK